MLDGKFKIDKDNYLTYHVKKPQGSKIPQQIKLSGDWSLDKDHNLTLTLNKWNNQCAGNKLTLKSELIDAKANALSFAVVTKDSSGRTRIYTLKLGGTWQADKYNRLVFLATKGKGAENKLILKGAWEVNKKNRIIYTYAKTHLKIKQRITKTITFAGYWDITGKRRISYILSKGINSRFDFKVSIGKPVKRGLQYEIGIGSASSKRALIIFGKWKADERLGLLFEMPYEKGRFHSPVFGASCRLDENHNLDFKLKDKSGKDLGIEVKLSRKILKGQGQAFIQALTSQKEISLTAGVGFRW